MLAAIANALKIGGLLARLADWLDDFMIKLQLAKKRKAEQDAIIQRANDIRARELPDDPRDYRD